MASLLVNIPLIGLFACVFSVILLVPANESVLLSMRAKQASKYRPVVIVHGILDHALELIHLQLNIQKAHPGTDVYLIPLYQYIKSAWPMWTQVTGFGDYIRNVSDAHPDGIILIGYSQGGLICRAVIQVLNIHTYISLASPQMGQYGDTNYLYLFPNYMKDNLYKLLYSRFGQTFSVGGYWKDPHHYDLYQSTSTFLPVLNNETLVPSPNMTLYRRNMLRLKKFIMIGGPDDGVVTLWQSSHFGFYNENETVVPFRQQEIYRRDSFGLRTLDKRGDLVILEKAGVHHTQWHVDPIVFRDLIEPWLS
ncbi:lysosomal thioesterase PPT2-A-like [Paramacrobiotus metropolitanus]|uniref:lysosomal thioesterase PPT2-A-like n=1 Tax=Paramacrobiotus metropolitanus TaxID=2943436 RepID=UPI002445EC17|nr:lysosomal thioesterase PPT2-A-like [Paramacrobiotus metropolitanus]